MKRYILVKTAYINKGDMWTGDIYHLVVMKNGEDVYSFNIVVGYEGESEITKLLEGKGYRRIYTIGAVYGKYIKSNFKGYKFDTLEDLKEALK